MNVNPLHAPLGLNHILIGRCFCHKVMPYAKLYAYFVQCRDGFVIRGVINADRLNAFHLITGGFK